MSANPSSQELEVMGEDSVSNVLLEMADEHKVEEVRGSNDTTARSNLRIFLEVETGPNPRCRCLLCTWEQTHLERGIKHLQTKHNSNAAAQSAVSDYLEDKLLRKRRRTGAGAAESSSAMRQPRTPRGWATSTTTSSSVSIADLLGMNTKEKLSLAYAKFAIATGASLRSVENPALHDLIDSVVRIAGENNSDMRQGASAMLFKKTAVSNF